VQYDFQIVLFIHFLLSVMVIGMYLRILSNMALRMKHAGICFDKGITPQLRILHRA